MQDFVIENGKLVDYNGNENGKSVSVPEEVTSIGEDAFDFSKSYIKELILPNTLRKLDDYSLAGLFWVEKIDIPESVTEMGDGVFFGWRSLKNVKLPSCIKNITAEMFGMCEDLECVSKNGEIEEIGHSAFYKCISLKEIDLTGVKKIGVYAFYSCQRLKEINIPDTVTEIEDCAFESCVGLKKVTLPNSIEKIGEHTFCGCTSLTSVEIPRNVKFIGKYAFAGCTALTEIRVPKGCRLNWGWKKGCNAKVIRY